jgi:hypothetical protein
LRRVDDYAVSLHLTPGEFKINTEIFAAAQKYIGPRRRFYISPLAIIPDSIQHCVDALAHRIEFSATCGKYVKRRYATGSGSDLVAPEAVTLEVTRSLPLPVAYRAPEYTGGKNDSQSLPRFHFFAVLLLSRLVGDFLQSKDGSGAAEIAHDA